MKMCKYAIYVIKIVEQITWNCSSMQTVSGSMDPLSLSSILRKPLNLFQAKLFHDLQGVFDVGILYQPPHQMPIHECQSHA